MVNPLLWIGAGDLAQRTMPYLDQNNWQTTAVNRQGNAINFDHTLAADVTKPETLANLPAATHIVYSATPGDRSPESYTAVYDVGLQNLLKHIDKSILERFIFISSTAVYGPAPTAQDERSTLNPPAFNGEALVKAEQFLRAELGDKLTVIRFTGLYGPGRDFLFNRLRAGKVSINPATDNYANRIHIEDAARVCAHVLQLVEPAESYVGTDSTPLAISELYTQAAQWLNAPAPALEPDAAYSSKHFSNQRLIESGTGFTFLYPDTLQGYKALILNN